MQMRCDHFLKVLTMYSGKIDKDTLYLRSYHEPKKKSH